MKIHCNSSLPRSGSELLQALLSQHPEIYASATSPLLEYIYAASGNQKIAEVKSQNPILMKKAFNGFCKEATRGYYSALTGKNIIIDKSRGWLEYAEFLWEIFPDARIICMTRKIEDIVKSLEKIYRANVMHPECNRLPKTPEARFNYWISPGNYPLGLALERLHNRKSLGEDYRIKYVDYYDLVKSPVEVMRNIFKFINLDPININPNNVKKLVYEDDSYYGIFGKHSVRSTISLI